MRGLLSDEYGIKPSDLRWRIGGLEEPAAQPLPTATTGEGSDKGVDITPIPPGTTLSGMLAEGGIDVLFSARPPSCFGRGDADVVRLFADYRAAEQAYYRSSGIYPLMHAVGIRNGLVEGHPWLAGQLFAAYRKAKDLAIAEFEKLSAFAVTLPWIEAEYRATQTVLGKDIWPYGGEANRKAIGTLCRYLHEQGFTRRRMTLEELFAPMAPA
jgi:4,5-dihydroxyphthalate decarboxylase